MIKHYVFCFVLFTQDKHLLKTNQFINFTKYFIFLKYPEGFLQYALAEILVK